MHVHTNDVRNSIANHIFHIISNMGFWFLMMGQALLLIPKGRNASSNDLVKLWEGASIICNSLLLVCKTNSSHIICVNMHIKRVDYLYNLISQCMIRLW